MAKDMNQVEHKYATVNTLKVVLVASVADIQQLEDKFAVVD